MTRSILALAVAAALLVVPVAGASQGLSSARAAERYYSSYGNPTPVVSDAPTSSSTSDTDVPGWTLAVIGGVVLALAAAGGGIVAGRISARPRHLAA
jgi:hypothetical protein